MSPEDFLKKGIFSVSWDEVFISKEHFQFTDEEIINSSREMLNKKLEKLINVCISGHWYVM